MIINKEGNTVIVAQENSPIQSFSENLNQAYETLMNDNLIVNLFSFEDLSVSDVREFLTLSNRHRASGKSFVLVSDKIAYDDIPEEICLAPTIQEAKDIIEMEEIERDLGL